MAAISKLERAVLQEVGARNEPVSIPALVEDYGQEIKDVLWTMRGEGRVRLIAIGDYSTFTSDELDYGCIQGCGEIFGYAEKMA